MKFVASASALVACEPCKSTSSYHLRRRVSSNRCTSQASLQSGDWLHCSLFSEPAVYCQYHGSCATSLAKTARTLTQTPNSRLDTLFMIEYGVAHN